jgi:rare lipoprotein A
MSGATPRNYRVGGTYARHNDILVLMKPPIRMSPNPALAAALLLAAALPGRAAPPAVVDTASPHVQAQARRLAQLPAVPPPPGNRVVPDTSGRKEVGQASVYAPAYEGHKMADGERFSETGHAAASRSLPLGTVAKVTDTQTGRTATVTIHDRGPFGAGRAVDVSKATARQIGLDAHAGVAPVVVAPVAVPQRDGSVKPGAGAVSTSAP